MDERTLAYYASHAAEAAARYESGNRSAFYPLLLTCCRSGARVLDVGCGSGRDVAFLRGRGVLAFGVDASASMVAEARRRHPEILPYVQVAALPELGAVGRARYDAALATAVFMHVPPSSARRAAARLREILWPGGTLVLSVPAARRVRSRVHRDGAGRLFHPYAAAALAALFRRQGFRLDAAHRRPDVCGRAGIEWVTLFLRTIEGC